MKATQTVAVVAAVLIGSLISLAAPYGGGSGDPNDPYQIWTAEQMNTIGLNPDHWDKHFKLMADIDMSDYTDDTGTPYNIIGIYNTDTHNDEPFTGTFDGNHFTITNLTIVSTRYVDYVGLFGLICGAAIQNLGVEDVLITSEGDSAAIGGIVGRSEWEGSLVNCYVTGSFIATGRNSTVGGLVGDNSRGSISHCYAIVSVDGADSYNSSAGGLVGENFMGTLDTCYSMGQVSGDAYNIYYNGVGGLIGYTDSGSVTRCYSTCTVDSKRGNAGGLMGINYAGTLTACYATGSVSGVSYVGGLAGCTGGEITACYATGEVSGNSNVGGLAGSGADNVKACFWDIESSGRIGSAGGKGLTTTQMKTLSIFQNAGWADKGWVMDDGADYPRLSWENTGGAPIPLPQEIPLLGSGTPQEPYRISTPQEFALLSWYSDVLNKHIELTENLDLTDVPLYPIGDLGHFRGVFHGNGHSISHAVINQPESDNVGLFGVVGFDGGVLDLIVENVHIVGRLGVGGLAGKSIVGTLNRCHVTGSVFGSGVVGGLVGNNSPGTLVDSSSAATVNGLSNIGGLAGKSWGSPITGCFASGPVSGGSYVGGLVGYHNGYTWDCYAIGSVSGTSYVGGLVGYNKKGMITGGLIGTKWGHLGHSYAAGAVSGSTHVGGLAGRNEEGYIEACFWNMETSGQTISNGGAGITTEEMQLLSTFTDIFDYGINIGWDFASAHSFGDWIMPSGSYPLLAWQLHTQIPIPDVRGLTEQEALSVLTAAGLSVYDTVEVYDETVPAGLISGTNPPLGMIAYKGLTQIFLLTAKDYHYSGGDGSAFSPYQISTVYDWHVLSFTPDHWDKHFKLINDIDFRGLPLTPIAADTGTGWFEEFRGTPFTGSFDGQYFELRNITINQPHQDYVGLFGAVESTGQIRNLTLNNITVVGQNFVGGLAGHIYNGVIANCSVKGSVFGIWGVGGVVGVNRGSLTGCSGAGSVGSKTIHIGYVGGLAGRSEYGIFSDCFTSAQIDGDYSIGGVVGGSYGSVFLNCYAAGSVNGLPDVGGFAGGLKEDTLTACFWDTQASGQNSGVGSGFSEGLTGKTPAQMQTLSTFADAGWDFTETWVICQDANYPRLRWQIPAADWLCPDGVGMEDLAYLAARWLLDDCELSNDCDAADLTGDGAVNLADFAILADLWLR
jgi:hypothetical protein